MFKLIVVVALAFALQFFLTSAQMSHFNKEFIKLRKQGRVACGRKSGGFHAGAIVMFQIDDNGIVQQAKKLEGVTCLARVRDLNGFEGRFV
ncbi:MAG: transcriptional regulator GutM, partial [Eubacterium sp.]|nr:transcriptional regulator GutM [Eubacterium sp.]